ncbi:MAG: hypothetical protein V3U76_06765 [Granulosicoccus sp.]
MNADLPLAENRIMATNLMPHTMNKNTDICSKNASHAVRWYSHHYHLISAMLIVLLGLILGQQPAEAAIYKCLENDGGISYSSTACVDSNQTARILANNGINDIGNYEQNYSEQKPTRSKYSDQQLPEPSEAEIKRRAERLEIGPMY